MAFALQASCPLRPARTFVPRSTCARVPQDLRRLPITLAAPFGVGSVPNEPENGESSSSKVLVPEDKTWGLSPRQMAALGITGEFAGMGVRGVSCFLSDYEVSSGRCSRKPCAITVRSNFVQLIVSGVVGELTFARLAGASYCKSKLGRASNKEQKDSCYHEGSIICEAEG